MASEPVPAAQGKQDVRIIAAGVAALVLVWGFVFSLPWIALRRGWFSVKSDKDVESIGTVLGKLGTYGDMFGALTCLFTGLAFIGAGYAVVLQLRALRHQQAEIERNERDRQAAEDAREKESRYAAFWQRRIAVFNATSSLAQALAARLASIPDEIIRPDDHERWEDMRQARADIRQQLDKTIEILANHLENVSNEHIAE